jgi:membrane fusion protein (multidrug efflux system)
MSPAAAAAGLAAIRAELQVMQARMILDGQRIDQSHEQLRVDLLKQKVDVAIANSRLIFAEGELKRVSQLQKDKIASQFEYDQALSNRDAAQAEVKERTALIAETEKVLATMKSEPGGADQTLVPQAINAAIAAQEEQFKLLSEAVLRAPIDGVVSKIYRLNGENIKSGEPLVTISGEHGESIIGFVRQPLGFNPKIGDKVVVRSRRGFKREAAEAQIVQVGGRLEFFAQALRVRGFDSSQERGLPVMINIPQDLKLHPGELVDLALKN